MPPTPFYPALNTLIDSEKVPELIRPFLENKLSKLFYKTYYLEKSVYGDTAYHSIVLVFNTEIGFNLFGGEEGFEILFNPGLTSGATELPLVLYYNLPILKYINGVKISDLGTPKDYFKIIAEITKVNTFNLLQDAIRVLLNNSFHDFVNHFNTNPNYSGFPPLITNVGGDDEEVAIRLVMEMEANGVDVVQYILEEIISVTNDIGASFNNLYTVFAELLGDFTFQNILDLLIPKFSVSFQALSLALAFPRSILQPVDLLTGEVIPGNSKSMLSYDIGSLTFHSEKGIEFNNPDNFDLTPSQIGNTGLILEIINLKFDFRTDKNIPEADADGRDLDFRGIYADYIGLTLPKKWFDSNENHPNTTARLAGYNMLIGTGGVSGTVALEVIDGTSAPMLIKTIGGNGFAIWFTSFDITFSKNAIVESNIEGGMKIPKLKDGNGDPASIDIKGHLDGNGDFSVTASEKDGFQPIEIPSVLKLYIMSLEVGKEDDNFFIGTSCEIEFTNTIMQQFLGTQRIKVSKLRIYSDGSFEIVGGAISVPTNFNLNLGPVEINVTGINYGSYQQEHDGKMRKYNYFGFDGGISLNPIGVDARGEGIKYYFTVDNNEDVAPTHPDYKPRHSFIRIQTIRVDITIPGNASAASATAIIKGFLSIAEEEYKGGISLKLPKVGISGSAEMALQPKYPAFIIDASIELPTPIPLAATGLGVFGFRGLLGYRYVAEKEAVGLVSGVDSWFDYYVYPQRGINIDKFTGPADSSNYENPVSLGAGASIAIYPNDSILSVRVFVLLSIPSLFLVEGKASIISKRYGLDDSGEPPFFAFLIIGDNSIEAGLGADFDLPQNNGWIVDLYAEVQAGFFFNNPSAWYVNFGTKQDPISAKILTLITMQTYLMISARGIEAGARAEFEFDKRYGPVRVRAYAYVEVGGFISFERPQIGAYFAVGGEALVDIWVASLYIGLDLLLGAEAPKPFLIYGKFRLCVSIKICWFIKIKFCGNVELKWEKNREVDRTPIAPLLPEVREEMVKVVHMLSGDIFDVAALTPVANNPGYIPSANDAKFNQAVVPIDSFIDIKFGKGLLPADVENKIGSVNNPPENYADLVPPQKVVRGGHELRQVKHHYSIKEINVKAWNGSSWVDYHPYDALHTSNSTTHLKIGHFQKSGKEYNAIRLLATSPFSYTEAGEPGWFIPEQFGLTAGTLFCQGVTRPMKCSNWLQKAAYTFYFNDAVFFSNFVYYTVQGASYYDNNNVLQGDGAEVVLDPNPYNFFKSLKFDNATNLSILLPEASTRVTLKLTNKNSVVIKYYRSLINDDVIETEYELITQISKTSAQLLVPVEYDDPAKPVSKIIIEPNFGNKALINALLEQIADLFEETYQEALANGETDINITIPNNVQLYNQLLAKLKELRAQGCIEVVDTLKIRCQIYNEIDTDGIDEWRFRIHDLECDILLSSSTNYVTQDAAITEMYAAVNAVLTDPNSIEYKQTISGEWYFNVIDTTGEVIARRIQYFDALALCQAAVAEVKTVLNAYQIDISEEPCTPQIPANTGGMQSDFWVNDYAFSPVKTVRKFDKNFYWGALHVQGESNTNAYGNFSRFDNYGDPLFTKTYTPNTKTKSLPFSPDRIVRLDDETMILEGVLNKVLTVSRIDRNGKLIWTKHFPVYSDLLDEHQIIKSEENTIVLAYINQREPLAKATLLKQAVPALYKELHMVRFDYDGNIIRAMKLNTFAVNETVSLRAMVSDNRLGGVLTMENYVGKLNTILSFDFDLNIIWKKHYNNTDKIYDLCYVDNKTLYALCFGEATSTYSLMAMNLTQLASPGTQVFTNLRWDIDAATTPYFVKDTYKQSLHSNALKIVVRDLTRVFIFEMIKGFVTTTLTQAKYFPINKKTIPITDLSYDLATNTNTLLLGKKVVGHLNENFDSCITELWPKTYRKQTLEFVFQDLDIREKEIPDNPYYLDGLFVVSELRLDIIEICNYDMPPPTHFECFTLLHEVCWRSVEDYIYNQNIPNQSAIQSDFDAGVEAISQQIAPVWRPNTKYHLHFRLQDSVDDGTTLGLYDYHFGFRTAGPVGHFHLDPHTDYLPSGENPDKYPLTSLRGYIDYGRSYPNADGNLINAKPLFYGDSEMLLFFIKPFTKHLLSDWPLYAGMPALEGEMKIVVKDPIEDVATENPPPPNVIDMTIPQTVESWTPDTEPLMPEYLQMLNNFVAEQANNPDLNCLITGANLIRPASVLRTIIFNYLKPLKLYTAIVNNIFEGVSKEVHQFVFQTSRYFDFEEQVNSFQLSDDQGHSKLAIFEIELTLTATDITTAYNIVAGNAANAPNLETQYLHYFDRAVEGVLGFVPIDPPLSTEFNIIRKATNNNTVGDAIAVLIRNPEPFNDPKIPLTEMGSTIAVLNAGGTVDGSYRVLFSKDYAQALIMHTSKKITPLELDFRFENLRWNGAEYEVKTTIDVENITINN